MSSGYRMETENKSRQSPCNEYFRYNVGQTLKKLRLSNNMTQKFVASSNGMSSGMISLIESNSISASIPTLAKLMKFYGVKMSWLFDDKNENRKYEIIRKHDRKILSRILTKNASSGENGFLCESLSHMTEKKMRPYIINLSDEIIGDTLDVHFGEVFMYVLKGVFELIIDGSQVVLKEGDSIYMDASLEHRFRSAGGLEVAVLVVRMAAA